MGSQPRSGVTWIGLRYPGHTLGTGSAHFGRWTFPFFGSEVPSPRWQNRLGLCRTCSFCSGIGPRLDDNDTRRGSEVHLGRLAPCQRPGRARPSLCNDSSSSQKLPLQAPSAAVVSLQSPVTRCRDGKCLREPTVEVMHQVL